MRASRIAVLVAVAALVASPSFADGQRKAPAGTKAVKAKAKAGGTRAVGTIRYDSQTPNGRDSIDGGTVGNRFSPPIDPHSVATVSFRAAGNYATSVVMTVWDVNPGAANVLARQLVTGIPQSTNAQITHTAVLTNAVTGHSGDFIAGIRNTDYDPCAGDGSLGSTCDGVALDLGTYAGQGFNAARINFTSSQFVPTITAVASSGTNINSRNAIFRVSGDIVPVELMQFQVE